MNELEYFYYRGITGTKHDLIHIFSEDEQDDFEPAIMGTDGVIERY